ncbi:butyrophilin subfamily 1 member A1-like isoform X1 [Xiphophorus maculatus]|uniref:Butyrophilin subfamily 1 member A1-like n=1 Tax=Xiphophorus maculatus TaxID=8083 RepID=M3ZRF1_XIPMA|nr:butyrophilin subfamily 1 member A1-like isoform X1 [Xiphophorus maculatus]
MIVAFCPENKVKITSYYRSVMYLPLVLVQVLLTGVSLAQAQPKQVDAFAGGDIILPCTFNIPANKDIPTVEWSKVVEGPKPVIVFLYRDGCEIFGMKDPDFEYRTNLILRQLQYGNYSLRISELKLSDSGTYQCLIIQKNGAKEQTQVELVVDSLSDPKFSVVSTDGGEVTVECKALCWKPAPFMTILDDEGKRLSDEQPKQEQDPRGCYNTKQNVTLLKPVNRLVCRVEQTGRNQSKVAEILLPGFWKESQSAAICLSAAGTAIGCLTSFTLYRLIKKRSSSEGRTQLQTATKSDQIKGSGSSDPFIQQSMADNKLNSMTEEKQTYNQNLKLLNKSSS